MRNFPYKQQGAALLVALMFLVILTLLSVNAMRSSTMELRMASNEQEQRIGFDSTQSALISAMTSSELNVNNVGDKTCFGFGATPDCQGTAVELLAGAGTGPENSVRTVLVRIAACPRTTETTIAGDSSIRTSGDGATGSCAYFDVDSTYDATNRRGGRTDTRQGYIKFLGL